MMNLPNPQPVLDPSEAFRRSKTMFAAVSVGVFEALHEGPASAAELAARLGANADAMARSSDRWRGFSRGCRWAGPCRSARNCWRKMAWGRWGPA